jgi:hypothetical protein
MRNQNHRRSRMTARQSTRAPSRSPVDPTSPSPMDGRVAILPRSTARVLTLSDGLYLIRIATTAEPPNAGGAGLSQIHVSVPPPSAGRANAVVLGGAESNCRSLPPPGGVVFAGVGSLGGTIVISALGLSEAAEASLTVTVDRLDQPASHLSEDLSPVRREIRAEIGMTIERLGLRRFASGGWAGSRGGHLRINALALQILDPEVVAAAEVKAFGAGDLQTDWVVDGKLTDFGGDEIALTGFAARIAPSSDGQFSVVYLGSFTRGGTVGPCRDGEPCQSPIRDDPLAAISLRIEQRGSD